MSSPPTLDSVIAEYLIRCDEGESPDIDELIDSHPNLAVDLRAFFDQEQKVLGQVDSAFSRDARFGPFQIVREIGRGSWGIVYLAKRDDSDDRFALKVLAGAFSFGPRERTRFRNEAELLGQLDHPNIVSILDAGWVGDTPYYCMPLMSDHCGELIESSRNQSDESSINRNPRHVAELIRQVAEGLSHAHRAGIVHRDVKPSNILLTDEQIPQLADFGVARTDGSASLTISGEFMGTLRFTSPEQLLGERDRIDGRTDIYSLGATMWEMLTLQPLVPSEGRNRIVHGVLNAEINSLSKLNPLIPHDLETIAIRCLQKDPAERYQTAAQLADDLGRFVRGDKILANRPSTADRLLAWVRSNRNSAAAILLCLTLAFVASLLSTFFVLRAQSETKAALETSRTNEGKALKAEELAKASELQAMRLFYAAEMDQANRAHVAGNVKQTRVHLAQVAEVDPDRRLRGIEWDYLWRQGAHRARLLCESSSEIYTVEPSPDGKQILVAGKDSNLQFFDATTAELNHSIPTDQNEINDITFSADGKLIATAGDDGTIKIWNAATRAHMSTAEFGKHIVWTASFLDDNRIVATCDNETLKRRHAVDHFRQFDVFSLDGELGQKLQTCGCDCDQKSGICRGASQLKVLPDGDVLGGRDAVHRWSEKNGKFQLNHQTKHYVIYDMEIDQSRNLVFVGCKTQLTVCDLETLEPMAIVPQPNSVVQVALFPKHGRVAISLRGGQVIVYRLVEANGKLERLERVDAWAVDGNEAHELVALEDEQRLLFSVENRLYETRLVTQPNPIQVVDGVYIGDQYSPSFLVVGEEGQIADSDVAAAVRATDMAHYAITAEAGLVAGISQRDRMVHVWDIKNGDLLYSGKVPDPHLNRLEFSRDGNYLALFQSGSEDSRSGTSTVLDWRNDQYTFMDESGLSRWNACFDHENRVVFAPRDRLLCRDAQSGEELWRDDDARVGKYAIHPQKNVLVVGTTSNWLEFRDSGTGKIKRRIPTASTVGTLAFTSDGKRLGYTRKNSADFFLVDFSTGRTVLTIQNAIQETSNFPATFINEDTVFAVRSGYTPQTTLLNLGPDSFESAKAPDKAP